MVRWTCLESRSDRFAGAVIAALGLEIASSCNAEHSCGSTCWIEVPLTAAWSFGQAQLVARRYRTGWIADVVTVSGREFWLSITLQLHMDVWDVPPHVEQALRDEVSPRHVPVPPLTSGLDFSRRCN